MIIEKMSQVRILTIFLCCAISPFAKGETQSNANDRPPVGDDFFRKWQKESRIAANPDMMYAELEKMPLQFSKAEPASSPRELFRTKISVENPYSIGKLKASNIYYIKFDNHKIQEAAFARLSYFLELRPGQIAKTVEEVNQFREVRNDTGPFGTRIIPPYRRPSHDLDYRAERENFDGDSSEDSGQDYRLSDVARFFTACRKQKMDLTDYEKRLESELLDGKLMELNSEQFVVKNDGALIGSTKRGKLSTFEHEFHHAVYFTNEKFQSAAKKLWKDQLSEKDRTLVKGILQSVYPYANDEDLTLREYLAHFRDPTALAVYLKMLGQICSKKPEKSHPMRSLFESNGTLTGEATEKVKDLSRKAASLDFMLPDWGS